MIDYAHQPPKRAQATRVPAKFLPPPPGLLEITIMKFESWRDGYKFNKDHKADLMPWRVDNSNNGGLTND